MFYNQYYAFYRNNWLPIIHEKELVRYALLAINDFLLKNCLKLFLGLQYIERNYFYKTILS